MDMETVVEGLGHFDDGECTVILFIKTMQVNTTITIFLKFFELKVNENIDCVPSSFTFLRTENYSFYIPSCRFYSGF